MYHKDFLMRQLHDFIEAIVQVISRMKEGEGVEAMEIATRTLSNITPDNREYHELSFSEVRNSVSEGNKVNPDFAFAVADLLIQKAKLHKSNVAKLYQARALYLYEIALRQPAAVMPLHGYDTMDELKKNLEHTGLLHKLYSEISPL